MINNNLTLLYKKVLQSSGLISTGKLMNSIVVDTSLVNNTLTINIQSLPYLVYLVKTNKLTEKFTMSQTFNDEVSKLIIPSFEDKINNILNGIDDTSQSDPQIILKYNGV